MSQTFEQFLDGLGLHPLDPIICDGTLRMFRFSVGGRWKNNCGYKVDELGGWVRNHREGVTHKWYSNGQITPAQKKAATDKRKAIERELTIARKKAAENAAAIYEASADALPDHPYLLAKQIKPYNAKRDGDKLIIPAYGDDGCIKTLQYIMSDGEKLFYAGGEVAGSYNLLVDDNEALDIVYVVEGFATAGSVREATAKPVVMAFTASNIPHVVKGLHKQYPKTRIIVAADNDQWSMNGKGESFNAGVHYASQVSDIAKIIPVPFSANHPDKLTDYNDLHRLKGLQAVSDILDPLPINANAMVPLDARPEGRADWVQMLNWVVGTTQVNGVDTLLDTQNLHNQCNIMLHHPQIGGCFAYDIFADCITIIKCPPWENEREFLPRPTVPHDKFKVKRWFSAIPISSGKKFNLTTEAAQDLLRESAFQQIINPPRDYFETLKWDGKKRLDTWLSYYLGAEQTDYTAFVGRKWLTAAVTRIYNPGAKFDTVLVLEGEQYIGKSMAFRILATFGNQCYFTDESLNFHSDKDSLLKLQGKIIVEMSELASWKRAKQDDIKAFITRQVDSYRPPYGHAVEDRPRMFILGATTNQKTDWLSDETGNRRYWPVLCSSIDKEALARDKEQLWAEAVVRFKEGEPLWLESEEYKLAEAEQEDRVAISVLRPDIDKAIEDILEHDHRYNDLRGTFTISEIMSKMSVPVYQKNDYLAAVIKRDLKLAGYKEIRRTVDGVKQRLWAKMMKI